MILLKPIVIVGIMGSGKSYFAKNLAKHLQLNSIDMDNEIKAKTLFSVKEIYDSFNIELLQTTEFNILKEALKDPKNIISTGDTIIDNQKAWNCLLMNGIVIWLNVDLKIVYQRLRATENRPHFTQNLTFQELYQIYQKRKKRYKNAHIEIKSFNLKKIVENLKTFENEIS